MRCPYFTMWSVSWQGLEKKYRQTNRLFLEFRVEMNVTWITKVGTVIERTREVGEILAN
jgi:hypothetical protein